MADTTTKSFLQRRDELTSEYVHTVHYISRLSSSQEVIVDTRAERGSEPVALVAGRDSCLKEVGLNLGVATMRRGERCRLQVSPEYGFGERGNFSFPSVAPGADLEYEVELIDFEAVAEDRQRSSLTYEERLETAARRRAEGNIHFQEDRLDEAMGRYQLALSYVDEELMIQLEGPHVEKAQAERTPLLLNMAACHLRKQDWHAAIASCQEVLAADPKNAKAIFRRGKAELRLGNTDAAARDLEAAHKLAPEDAAISRETRELKRQLQQDRAAQAELFRGRLPSASPPPLLPPFSVAETNKPVLWRGIAQLLQFLQTVVGWFLPSVMVQQYERPHGE